MKPEEDPIANDARKARRSRRLPPGSSCALCGETDPASLQRSLLESHHVAGRANDRGLTVVLCRNCHAKATSEQIDVGAIPPGRAPTVFERLILALRSLGTFFELLAKSCYAWATQLTAAVATLDANYPDWRTDPGLS